MAKKIYFKKTEDIRQKSAEEAIDSWVRNDEITSVVEGSTPKSETNMQRLSINLPENMHRKLKNICALEGVSIKEKVINILIKELDL